MTEAIDPTGSARRGPFDLGGQAALVTGASRGLGRAIAVAFAQAGADVALLGRDREALATTAAEVEATGRRAHVLTADLRRVVEIRAAVAAAIEGLGGLDILVNCAGTVGRQFDAPTLAVTEEDWDEQLDVMLKAVFFASQAAAAHMIENGGGRIINISSNFGVVGYEQYHAYCAAKAGVINLTRSMADDLAKHSINVNALAPGAVTTEGNREVLSDPTIRELVLSRIPSRRISEPEDVAQAAVFLASRAATNIHGACLAVDGGYTAV
jgi:2-deoxy-D-gluconate 3-dehydrogenase